MDTSNTEYYAKMAERKRITELIKDNINRCMRDKHPGYDRAVAIYNDLLKLADPEDGFTIEYDGHDCKIKQ